MKDNYTICTYQLNYTDVCIQSKGVGARITGNMALNERSCYRPQSTRFIRQHFAHVPFLVRVFARHFC